MQLYLNFIDQPFHNLKNVANFMRFLGLVSNFKKRITFVLKQHRLF
jgi:hypothetical protein